MICLFNTLSCEHSNNYQLSCRAGRKCQCTEESKLKPNQCIKYVPIMILFLLYFCLHFSLLMLGLEAVLLWPPHTSPKAGLLFPFFTIYNHVILFSICNWNSKWVIITCRLDWTLAVAWTWITLIFTSQLTCLSFGPTFWSSAMVPSAFETMHKKLNISCSCLNVFAQTSFTRNEV